MSDKILLQNMMFYGFHGVYEHERELGQRFYLDVEMSVNSDTAGKTDNLNDTVDYTAIYNQIKDIVENHRFHLLEALGAHIAEAVLSWQQILQVSVRIRKPAVPIPGELDYVQVEITRGR